MLRYAQGDAAAFDTLYGRHRGGVFRYLLRHLTGNRAAAEELFQDVWMNLIGARGRYRVEAKFTTWLYTMAHNRVIDHYRRHRPLEVVSLDGGEDDDPPEVAAPPTAQPERMAEARQQAARLLALLDASAGGAARGVPAARGRRLEPGGDRARHRQRSRSRQEPAALCHGQAQARNRRAGVSQAPADRPAAGDAALTQAWHEASRDEPPAALDDAHPCGGPPGGARPPAAGGRVAVRRSLARAVVGGGAAGGERHGHAAGGRARPARHPCLARPGCPAACGRARPGGQNRRYDDRFLAGARSAVLGARRACAGSQALRRRERESKRAAPPAPEERKVLAPPASPASTEQPQVRAQSDEQPARQTTGARSVPCGS